MVFYEKNWWSFRRRPGGFLGGAPSLKTWSARRRPSGLPGEDLVVFQEKTWWSSSGKSFGLLGEDLVVF